MSVLPLTWADKEDSPNLADFLAKFGAKYILTAAEINQLRDAVNEMGVIQQSVFLGTVEPGSSPTGTGRAYWTAITPGTYTNFGGVVVASNSLAMISRNAAGVFSISQNTISLTGYSTNAKVTKVAVKATNNNDSTTLINKFREYNLGFETWTWTDASATAGIKPNLGSMPIWATTTNAFITIPITNLDVQTSTNFGVIFECYSLLNDASFASPDAILQVNGSYINFTLIRKEKVGQKYTYVGKYNLSTIPGGATINLILAIHAISGVSIVGELSNIRLFYLSDADITSSIFTVKDKTNSIDGLITDNVNSINTLNQKFAAIHSKNYLNPATFRIGYFYYSGQNGTLQYNLSSGCGSTDYIPAKVEGLITLNAGTTVNGVSSYAVFDKNKVWLRNGQNSDVYSYVAGDGFVVFVYTNINAAFPYSKAVNIGNVYTYDAYSENVPLDTLTGRVAVVENKGTTVIDVKNGSPLVYGNVSNFTGAAISSRDIPNDSLVYSRSGTGNSWILSPVFIPLGSNLVHIKFKAEFTKVGTTKGIQLIVAEGTGASTKFFNLGSPIRNNGDYELTFDPAYYNVYEGITQFYIWINNENILAGESFTCKLTGLKVFEYKDSIKGANIKGLNSKELFESTDNELTNIKSQVGNAPIFISPLGNKFELNVSNTGVLSTVPIIPTKAAYFGNSLIGGFGSYGMAASDAQYDYYNRINTFITGINSGFTAYKASGASAFEGATTEGQLVTAINAMIAALAGDETLVCIQLGDNVNTTDKNIIFNGGGCLRLLQAVRAKCPGARVVWMGMWYGSTERYTTIDNSCKATGAKFISFSDLISPSTVNAIGNITKSGTSTRTLSGVTSIVDNTSTNITVNFTVSSVSYQSTLNVTSYSLSAGVLTYTGLYEIISSGGVASHPSDEGFRRIANKFLFEMKLTADPEYYK